MIGAYAGSFDPPTKGHEDIIRRAAALCEKLVVLVAPNSLKHSLLDEQTRLSLLKAITQDLDNVEVDLCQGLTVEAARGHGANVLIRSMRNASDYPGEAANAWTNAGLKQGLDTLFLLGDPAHSLISSTTVRELLRYDQSIADMVPRAVFEALQPELAFPSGKDESQHETKPKTGQPCPLPELNRNTEPIPAQDKEINEELNGEINIEQKKGEPNHENTD